MRDTLHQPCRQDVANSGKIERPNVARYSASKKKQSSAPLQHRFSRVASMLRGADRKLRGVPARVRTRSGLKNQVGGRRQRRLQTAQRGQPAMDGRMLQLRFAVAIARLRAANDLSVGRPLVFRVFRTQIHDRGQRVPLVRQGEIGILGERPAAARTLPPWQQTGHDMDDLLDHDMEISPARSVSLEPVRFQIAFGARGQKAGDLSLDDLVRRIRLFVRRWPKPEPGSCDCGVYRCTFSKASFFIGLGLRTDDIAHCRAIVNGLKLEAFSKTRGRRGIIRFFRRGTRGTAVYAGSLNSGLFGSNNLGLSSYMEKNKILQKYRENLDSMPVRASYATFNLLRIRELRCLPNITEKFGPVRLGSTERRKTPLYR